MPVEVPGAADSPGTRICSFANAPRLTVIAGLVLAGFVTSVPSEAVTVALPAVLRVMLNDFVPSASSASSGKAALESDELIDAVSVAFVATFGTYFDLLHVVQGVTTGIVPSPSGPLRWRTEPHARDLATAR